MPRMPWYLCKTIQNRKTALLQMWKAGRLHMWSWWQTRGSQQAAPIWPVWAMQEWQILQLCIVERSTRKILEIELNIQFIVIVISHISPPIYIYRRTYVIYIKMNNDFYKEATDTDFFFVLLFTISALWSRWNWEKGVLNCCCTYTCMYYTFWCFGAWHTGKWRTREKALALYTIKSLYA